MSFQDVGKPGASRRPPSGGNSVSYRPSAYGSSSQQINRPNANKFSASDDDDNADSGRLHAQASDSIKQYQKNVGLLETMNAQVGTKADGPVLETQYKVQVGVVNELGSKIEQSLRSIETSMSTMTRTEAARCRATHVKLTRDFRSVEAKFKKLLLESRRKRNAIEAERREREDVERRKNEEDRLNQEDMQQKVQMQEDRFAEEIMREREREIKNINKGMHQVNEIYKDLANIVGEQQVMIDKVETTTEQSKNNAEAGLAEVTKANNAEGQCVIS